MTHPLTEHVDKKRFPMADRLAEECVWQAERLAETRALIGNTKAVIKYDNGGGQTGVRKNPAFEAYAQQLNGFLASMRALNEVLAEYPPTSEDGRMTLANLKVMVGDKLKAAK